MKTLVAAAAAVYAWHLAVRAVSRRRMFTEVNTILGRR